MIKHTKSSRKLSRNPSKSVWSNAPESVRTASSFAQPFQNDRIVYKIFAIPVPAEIGYQLDFHFNKGNNLSKSWIHTQTVSSHLYNKFVQQKYTFWWDFGCWPPTTTKMQGLKQDRHVNLISAPEQLGLRGCATCAETSQEGWTLIYKFQEG